MPSVAVRPPNRPSSGALALRRGLGNDARVVRRDPIPRQYRTVINWGNSSPFNAGQARVINPPDKVGLAVNKLSAFRVWQEADVSIPEFRTTAPTVERGEIWLARQTLTGHSGQGISVIREGSAVPNAPLYVKYVRKSKEYRAHVVNGRVIFVQEKKRRLNFERDANQNLIRNYDNGWVFALTNEGNVPQGVHDEAIKAVNALGLDFGAVDLIVGKRDGRIVVLEINTAPGVESPTLLAAYTAAFKERTNG